MGRYPILPRLTILGLAVFFIVGVSCETQEYDYDHEALTHEEAMAMLESFYYRERIDNFMDDTDADLVKSCSCSNDTCSCCLHMHVSSLGFRKTVCLSARYLPGVLGLEAMVTLDGRTVISKSVSAKNPPPICFGVPHFKRVARICIEISQLSFKGLQVFGCAALDVRMLLKQVLHHNFGCFRIPTRLRTGELGGFGNGWLTEDMLEEYLHSVNSVMLE